MRRDLSAKVKRGMDAKYFNSKLKKMLMMVSSQKPFVDDLDFEVLY